MGRPIYNKVDYFPHVAKPGKTLFILEGKYGNDGYAFWFKLLELLSDSENHVYNAAGDYEWQYLLTRAKISEVSATEILDLLAKMGNIDINLWQEDKIIWCQALVDNFAEIYRKRKRDLPCKPSCRRKTSTPVVSATETPQSKAKQRKEKNPPTPLGGNGVDEDFEKWYAAFPPRRKQGKPKVFKKWQTLKKSGQLLPIEDMLKILEAQKKSIDWTKNGGDYTPGPEPYLNKMKYLDESLGYSQKSTMDDYMDNLEKTLRNQA